MAVAVANPVLAVDGDAALVRVNNRVPAHALPPGEVARAVNCRFENGKPGPRFGVASDPWGQPVPNLALGLNWSGPNESADLMAYVQVTGLEVGRSYKLLWGDAVLLSTGKISAGGEYPNGAFFAPAADPLPFDPLAVLNVVASPYTFVAQATAYYLWAPYTSGGAVRARWTRAGINTCAYKRFSDPLTDTDNGILLTDDWRDGADEDGGRGRAWRIYPGNGPQAIPLNGHDLWGTCRLIQCRDAMICLRHGNERHYWSADKLTAGNALNDEFPLNVAPSWGLNTAKRVRFEAATDGAAIYALTQNITDTDATADTLTIVGHGIVNGTAKKVTGITGITAGAVKYVRSVSADTIALYDTAAHAIAGGATGLFDVTVDDETGTLSDNPPASGNYYFAKHIAGNKVELYQNSALSEKILFSPGGSVGRFFIELAEAPAPFFGNGAPNLILEPTEIGNNAFEVGFEAVRGFIEITDTDTNSITAPRHGFIPGDRVVPVGLTIVTAGPYYAYPVDQDTIRIFTDQTEALVGNVSDAINDITADGTGSIAKNNASGLPMPACREGVYLNGRFWGINEQDNVVFSDPNDFLHFTQYQSTVPANQGEAGRANWLLPLGEDAILIGKDNKIIVIAGVGGPTSGWTEGTITDEYGGIAALAASSVGTDGWCFSRKGVASIVRTVAGERLGVQRTISENIPGDLKDVDWFHAFKACSETWNNRFFLAVPTKGQSTVVNNKVLVLNFLNGNLRVQQEVLAGDIVGGIVQTDGQVDSWEGYWEGDLLTPYAFARVNVNGEERLTFATPDGMVCWLHDGWDDAGAEITSEVLTRGYFGGREMLVTRGKLNWESYNPKVTASLVSAGVNEEETLAGFEEKQYDRTKYLTEGTPDYDPATSTEQDFDQPHREDYSPTAEELLVARVDVHQNLTEPFYCRDRVTAPQLRIVNEQGSLRVCAVSLQGKPVGISATRKT